MIVSSANIIFRYHLFMTNSITFHQNLHLTIDSDSKEITAKYRKDIDGLRAIAVLLVVFYHIFGPIFPGGFIGVDIFFVISGYLISSHIIAGLETDRLSLKEFYLRRIRRILPAFIFVLFIVNLVGFFVLIPQDLKLLFESSLSAILSTSNLYFWRAVSISYFHTDATILPLLHTWSLGIEEQFYLIWPITLFLLFYGLRRLGIISQENRRVFLGYITVFLVIISFFLYYYFRLHQNMVFYSPLTRAFELLSGAGLAIYWNKLKPPSILLSFLLSILGLLVILYAACCLKQDDYPSSYILLPCIGALLLIYSGNTENTIINEILSFRIMTFLGLISYSLYLWHWPIVAYINYFGIVINTKIGLEIFFASICLSFLSWKYIEQPFRNRYKYGFKNSILLFLIIPILLIGSLVLACREITSFGFNQIHPTILKTIVDYFGPYNNANCIDSSSPFHQISIKNCSIGDLSKDKPSVLVVGDSHAMASAGLLNVMLNNAHLKGYLITQSGTPFIAGNIKEWRDNSPMKRNALISEMIKKNHYDYVVLGGFWNYYPDYVLKGKKYSNKNYVALAQGIDNAIKTVVLAKSIPVLILDIPPLLRVPIICGFTRIGFNQCFNSTKDIMKIEAVTRNFLVNMKHKYPNMRFIDPSRVICQNKQCVSAINGIPLYHSGGDNSHLNYAGSTLIGEIYLRNFGNPFA